MKGRAVVSVSRDILEDWETYAVDVRNLAEVVAFRHGGQLTDAEPTFEVTDGSLVLVGFEIVK